jgi:hypothetical protein
MRAWLPRRHRVRLAWLTLFALLLQQMALVAHACTPDAAATAPVAAHACDPSPPPVDDLLCAKHCAPDLATAGDPVMAKLPMLPPAAVALQPLAVLSRPDAGIAAAVPPAGLGPPPALQYCSLLI